MGGVETVRVCFMYTPFPIAKLAPWLEGPCSALFIHFRCFPLVFFSLVWKGQFTRLETKILMETSPFSIEHASSKGPFSTAMLVYRSDSW